MDIESEPASAENVPLKQFVRGVLGAAMVTPAGSVFVNDKPLTVVISAVLSIMKVSVELLPGPMVVGENAMLNDGGAA
ncbi:MAG: hypothetical protein KBT81_09000 [Oleispira antarctica]|nr:hypothetical protein [Oleispira antarctica]